MPYPTNADLPPSLRNHLPYRAQTVYRQAFNRAWFTYAHDPRREEIAHRISWTAVKRDYRKDVGGMWVPVTKRAA